MPESDARLKPDQLYRKCRPEDLEFATTEEVEELDDFSPLVGQPRVEQALHFGVGIQRDGYNIFALGAQGAGKHTFIEDLLRRRAKKEPSPPDICYVKQFRKASCAQAACPEIRQGKRAFRGHEAACGGCPQRHASGHGERGIPEPGAIHRPGTAREAAKQLRKDA